MLGYDTRAYNQAWGRWLYNLEIPFGRPVRELDKFLGILSGLGLPTPQRAPEYFVQKEARDFARDFLIQAFGDRSAPVVGLFVGGKTDRKERKWPQERYMELARRLMALGSHRLLLLLPPQAPRLERRRESTFWWDEGLPGEAVKAALGDACPVFQESDLARVAALLKELRLVICPDGGIMHLAAAVGAPTLALFFGTDPAIWHPPVPTSHFLQSPAQDPSSLSVDVVMNKVRQLLNLTSHQP